MIPIWDKGDGRVGFVGPASYTPYLQTVSMEYVRSNLNRDLYVDGLAKLIGPKVAAAPASPTAPNGRPAAAPGPVVPQFSAAQGTSPGKPSPQGSSAQGPTAKGPSSPSPPKDFGDGQRSPRDTLTEKNLPPFAFEHVHNVMAAFKQMGPEKFAQAFLRSQPVVLRQPDRSLRRLMDEYFISINLVRKPFFGAVDMRRSGHIFTDLTLLLDQIVVRSFEHLPRPTAPLSINLNIHSVFTKTFESFMAKFPMDLLTVEFSQSNIVEYYDEFMVAKSLLMSKGAKIAADKLFPDTLGLVNLEFVGVTMAKFHWASGAAHTLRSRTKAIKFMRDSGIQPVMTRVDDQNALEVGREMGVDVFQGYLMDDMLASCAA